VTVGFRVECVLFNAIISNPNVTNRMLLKVFVYFLELVFDVFFF